MSKNRKHNRFQGPPKNQLPSSQVVFGQTLTAERTEALAALKSLLGARPAGFSVEDWAVVHATLDPDRHAHITQKRGPWQQYMRAARARNCFPGLQTPEALRAFAETERKPHVAELISTFRALEALDILEHRAIVRRAAHAVLGLHETLHDQDWVQRDPKGAAALGKEVIAAGRALMEMDDLKISRHQEEEDTRPQEDPVEDLPEIVHKVMEDMAARQVDQGEPTP